MQTSGLILDMHDDLRGDVVRAIYPSIADVPETVKTAQRMGHDDLDALPDDVFALVLKQGDATLRKYACVDPGNTVLHVEYFLKTAHKLPLEAQKLAARNLMTACSWYSIDPPEELRKVAFAGMVAKAGLGALNVLGKVQQGLGAVKAGGQAMKGLTSNKSSIVGHGVTMSASDKMAAAMRKVADLTFTETMPAASSADRKPQTKKAVITKHGGARQQYGAQEKGPSALGRLVPRHTTDHTEPQVNAPDGHPEPISQDWDFQLTTGAPSGRQFNGRVMAPAIEVSGKEGPPVPVYEKKASRHALGDRYPLDNLLQIKRAAAYFDEFGMRMTPAERREYCVNMVKAAESIGLDVSYEASKYGAARFAPADEMKLAMDVRARALLDDGQRVVLERLFEKRATVSPDVFCSALQHFDQMTGLHHYYDQYVPDPFWSTFGVEKRAEYEEVIGNDMITGQQLRDMTNPGAGHSSSVPLLCKAFGHEFVEEFRRDPVGIFKSMPRDQKLFIMRLAGDNAPSSTD